MQNITEFMLSTYPLLHKLIHKPNVYPVNIKFLYKKAKSYFQKEVIQAIVICIIVTLLKTTGNL